ncbi:MAG: LTA synthase family protein [Phascolarctobacterium sp.]|nr:LTA synthase family protein [Phascolarctobacterium sp.]
MFANLRLRFALLIKILSVYCFVQFILRAYLWKIEASAVSNLCLETMKTFSLGFVYDIVVGMFFMFPLALLIILKSQGSGKFNCKALYLLLLLFFGSTFFAMVSEYYFWQEFHTRFNFIAVDYLVYTHEIIGNIMEAYPIGLLLSCISVASLAITYIFNKKVKIDLATLTWPVRFCGLSIYVLILALATSFMKSNMTGVVSSNVYNQELASNGVFQLFHAFFNNELDYERFYVHGDNQEILAKLKKQLSLDGNSNFNGRGISREIKNTNSLSNEKPNIVVIVVESLSDSFTGLNGNKESFTPYLDQLAKKSFHYSNVYATGTRTVRGLEAYSLNLPPTPGQSIVRRPDSDKLFTVGTVLRKRGYQPEFVYGGYGYFDNMNGFFADNGYKVIDRTDIPKEEIYFDTIWGVADEILFDNVIKELDKQYLAHKPTMQFILTTTNHSPYTFPKGSIDAPQKKRESVVRYTDYAINKFLKQAQGKPWFDNTVFVITADHNASAAGKISLPINKYKIPCLVYAPKLLAPGRNDRLMSQIDIMPTVFGMLGISYTYSSMGYDINKLPEGAERAFIGTYQQLGYVHNNKLVVLEPQNKIKTYQILDYDKSEYKLLPDDHQEEANAVTWYQGASYLFKNKLLKEENIR